METSMIKTKFGHVRVTSPVTPGDHDELIAALRRKAKFFERPEGGANETFLLLNQAADALRAEQSARQAAEARLTEIFEQWQRSFMGADLLTKEFAERVTPMMHEIRAERRNAPTESKEPDHD